MFFVHRVIFGFWTLKRSSPNNGVFPKNHWSIWPPDNYVYNVRWDWSWKQFPNRKIPWHRCWDWRKKNAATMPKSGF